MHQTFTQLLPKICVFGVFLSIFSLVAVAEPYQTIINNGSPQNRVDIAVLGDGYTAAQLAQYQADVQSFMQTMFGQEPYREYQRFYNVHRIDVTSNESGADHSNRIPPVFVDTALDAAYNCNNIQRLICVNTTQVNQVISRTLPASYFDVILVIVNDTEYGGSGGSVAVASIHQAAVEIILHEVGHSFGLLADEYAGGGPSCNPNIEPPQPNATRETVRALIKWNHWIDASTPIPTTTMTPAIPGLYVGAKYCDVGLYRPTYNNKMRQLGFPFEQINTEQHVKRVYNFVSPIDTSSPAGTTVAINTNQSQTFSVTTPLPFTHNLNINWLVDGQQLGTGTSFTVNGGTLLPGTHTVQAVITDSTPFVRNDPQQLLSENRDWSLNIQAAPRRSPFDFDSDGKTDIGIFRPGPGEWWYQRSSDGQVPATQFGATTDKIVPGDYTGDGKADIAVWRPSTGFWYVIRSEDNSFFAFPFGQNGDVPVPADYDNDGKFDTAVFRPSNSTWFIPLSGGGGTSIFQFGITGDQPTVADYDGDGKADVAIFRPGPGEWWIQRSTAGILAFQFGAGTDKPVQGDYTGDGKADAAFWRPSNGFWYIIRSEDFSFFALPFGQNGDIVAPGDYDGDGKFDLTVFRPTQATWYIQRTTAGTQIVQFGINGDRPIANAFVP